MTDESFIGTKNALKIMQKTDKLLALYTYLEAVLYHTEPCTIKPLWYSSKKTIETITFPKGKYVYNRLTLIICYIFYKNLKVPYLPQCNPGDLKWVSR